ncbi:MAG TPA: biotin/lipoyl-containing protein [Terriglobales bacterium]|nr:biotin/lipoyl-containing protein [Terriglobales bacterium]
MTYDVAVTSRDGKTTSYKVELKRSDAAGWICQVDGQPFTFDSAQPAADVLSLLVGGESYEVRRETAASNGNGQTGEQSIAVGGRRYVVEVSDPRSLRSRKAKAGSSEGPKKIKAPMPGKVVRILAAEGDAVEAGQGVVVIEAMKMQNELKSPKAGTLKRLIANVGMAVNAGDTLAIVE